jgi:histidinol-phosphate aminotransferase
VSVATFPELVYRRASAFRGYTPGQAAASPGGKLSSNEAPLGAAPGVREAILAAVPVINRYPHAAPLVAAIAEHESLDPSWVAVTNGSDELCYVLAALFIEPGAPVVLSDPCYQIDDLVSRVQGGRPVSVPLLASGGHDLEGMIAAAIEERAAVLWLPSPHNPTGVAVDPAHLTALLDAVPATCLVVLDEAYRAYLEPAQRPPSSDLVARHPNLLVQRTFSKDYGLAGLRIGYGIAAPDLIEAINRVKAPFNVNALAIAAAQAALASQAWRAYGVALVVRERERLELTLAELGVRYFTSQANFVTFRPPSVEVLMAALSAAGVVVRDGADLGLPGWVRVSIGSPPVMSRLRGVLREVL